MDINVTTPIAHFGPANLSLSHIWQCIMRKLMTFATRILLGCRHQWRLVLNVWHVWERRYTYIYGYGTKCRRNKNTLKTGVQRKRLIKVRTWPHSVKTSDAFALLLPKHIEFITLQKTPSTFNKHCKISPHLGNRFTIDETNIVIEIYNRQPLNVDNLTFTMDHTRCSSHICYFSLRYCLTKYSQLRKKWRPVLKCRQVFTQNACLCPTLTKTGICRQNLVTFPRHKNSWSRGRIVQCGKIGG
jgi:hypothetical protein